jgi:hypothetical protein
MCRPSPESLAENTQATFQTYTALCTFVSCRATLQAEQCFQGCGEDSGKKGFPWEDKQSFVIKNHSSQAHGYQGLRSSPPAGGDESTEWLSFNHIPRRGLIYPERLRIEHPFAFELILPGPTTVPLIRMLEEYSSLVPAFRDLVSISYLWCHSLDMREISPTCLALLFVSFLQV